MRYISLILSGEIIGYESGKKKVQLTLLWTFHRKRTASSCVSTWRSLMKSDLLWSCMMDRTNYFSTAFVTSSLIACPSWMACWKCLVHVVSFDLICVFKYNLTWRIPCNQKSVQWSPALPSAPLWVKNPFYILVKLAWLLNRLKSSEHLFPIIKNYLKPWISSMSCCLADGQRVPETPQATGVTTIPDHRTEMNMWRDTFILFLQSEYL